MGGASKPLQIQRPPCILQRLLSSAFQRPFKRRKEEKFLCTITCMREPERLDLGSQKQESRLRLGKDFLIASSPSRGDASSIITPFEGLPRIVVGCSHESTNAARQLYESVANKVCCVSNPKTANAVQLAENIFRDVNIGELLPPL